MEQQDVEGMSVENLEVYHAIKYRTLYYIVGEYYYSLVKVDGKMVCGSK